MPPRSPLNPRGGITGPGWRPLRATSAPQYLRIRGDNFGNLIGPGSFVYASSTKLTYPDKSTRR